MNNKVMSLLISSIVFGLILFGSLIPLASASLTCSIGTQKVVDTNDIKIADEYVACLADCDNECYKCGAGKYPFSSLREHATFFDESFTIPLLANSASSDSKVYLLDKNAQSGFFWIDDAIKITTAFNLFDGHRSDVHVFESNKIDVTNLFPTSGGEFDARVQLRDIYGEMIGNAPLYFQIVHESCIPITPPVITCNVDSECGTNGYVGDNYCKADGNVYRDYKTFTCNNKGTPQSFCSSQTTAELIQNCAYGCANGACKPQPPVIVCSTNAQCGTDGYVGNAYCGIGNNEGNVLRNYKTNICNLPGTQASYCSNVITARVLEECAYGCTNGSCNPQPPHVNCCSNADCGTSGYIGNNYCLNENVYRDYREFTCNLPGTSQSYCLDIITAKLIQNCAYGCANGACNPNPNHECGNGILESGEICDDGTHNGDYGHCNSTCTGQGSHCGDGVLDSREECDDGNTHNRDGCSSSCEEEEDDEDNHKSTKINLLPQICESEWKCSGWTACYDGIQTRNCSDLNECEVATTDKPAEIMGCDISVTAKSTESGNWNWSNSWLLWLLVGIAVLFVLIILVLLIK